MQWILVGISTSHAGAEGASDFFLESGAAGVEIDDPLTGTADFPPHSWDYAASPVATKTDTVIVKAYLPTQTAMPNVINGLQHRMVALRECGVDVGAAQVFWRLTDDSTWKDQWRRYFHTHKVGKMLVIKPSWEEYQPAPGEVVLALDPGAAFGTGLHASTTLCLRCLEKCIKPGAVVLDVGTGSGILALAAAKLGAAQVLALDQDPLAVQAATDNVRHNNLSGRITVRHSDLLQQAGDIQAQVVIANIVADVVIRLAPTVPTHLAPGGMFIAGGIIAARLADVTAALTHCDFRVEEVMQEQGWAAIVAVYR